VATLAFSEEEYNALPDYLRGMLDGMWRFAWWKDGEVYVGTTGTTYAQAVDDLLKEKNRR
jgi:hypothetical protein